MLALEPWVVDALWAALEPELPVREEPRHPLGCHRCRILDRDVFEGILFRLVTGCSWDVAGRLGKGGETTLRTRYNAWNADGVFDRVVSEALEGYDRIVGLDLTEAAVDGSVHKAPGGGEGTGKSPVDRGKSGWKWSLLTDRWGIPVGWAADGANRHDQTLLEPTLGAAACSVMSRPCTLIAAMPGTRSSQPVTASASTTWCAPPNAPTAQPAASPRPCRWGSAGQLSAPTRGCRTSDSYGAAPTATPKHASANSPWPSH